MSTELLRRAASEIRERAVRSICPCGGPVCTVELGWFREGELRERLGDGLGDREPRITSGDAVPHVLAWSPAVALAVADWLDAYADRLDVLGHAIGSNVGHAIAVARAYLGNDA